MDFVEQLQSQTASDDEPKEIPAIISTWDWGSLVSSIKKQSETLVQSASKDVGDLSEYLNIVSILLT
jgi:hypothetical protein